MRNFLETVHIIFTSRESGSGYFGGAEGAIRILLIAVLVAVAVGLYYLTN